MPKTYSVTFTGNRNEVEDDPPSPAKTAFYSSLAIANKAARDITAADGAYMEAVVRQHSADKASMDTILDALNGTGWADPRQATIVKQFRNGRAFA